jgi:hypothetical protein
MTILKRLLAVSLSTVLPMQSLQASLLPSPATTFSISIPSALGYISETHSPKTASQPDIIFIQDLHVNRSVQFAITGILKQLKKQGFMPDHIAVEGDTGLVDIQAMQSAPDVRARKKTADYLVRQGEMPGAMHFVVTEGEGALFGIETEDYYQANLDMYRLSYQGRVAQKDIDAVRRLIATQVIPEELPATLREATQAASHLKTILPGNTAKDVIQPLSAALNFYALALLRNEEMFNNLLALRQSKNQQTSIIVTGGFHTEALTKLCKAQGLSYAVVTPNVRRHSKIDENLYVARMLGQHLTPEQVATGQNWAMMQMVLPVFKNTVGTLFSRGYHFFIGGRRPVLNLRRAVLGSVALAACGTLACTFASNSLDFKTASPSDITSWAIENKFPDPLEEVSGHKASRFLLPSPPLNNQLTVGSLVTHNVEGLNKFSYGQRLGATPDISTIEVTVIPKDQSLQTMSADIDLTNSRDDGRRLHRHGLKIETAGNTRFVRILVPRKEFLDSNGQPYQFIDVHTGRNSGEEPLNIRNIPGGIVVRGYDTGGQQGALDPRGLPMPGNDGSILHRVAQTFFTTLEAAPPQDAVAPPVVQQRFVVTFNRRLQTIPTIDLYDRDGIYQRQAVVTRDDMTNGNPDRIILSIRSPQSSALTGLAVQLSSIGSADNRIHFRAERARGGRWHLVLPGPNPTELEQALVTYELLRRIDPRGSSDDVAPTVGDYIGTSGVEEGAEFAVPKEVLAMFPGGFSVLVNTGQRDLRDPGKALNQAVIPSDFTVEILKKESRQGGNQTPGYRTEPKSPVKMGTRIEDIAEFKHVTPLERAQRFWNRLSSGATRRLTAAAVGIGTVLSTLGLSARDAGAAELPASMATGPMTQQVSNTIHMSGASELAHTSVSSVFEAVQSWAQNFLEQLAVTERLSGILQQTNFQVDYAAATLIGLALAAGTAYISSRRVREQTQKEFSRLAIAIAA